MLNDKLKNYHINKERPEWHTWYDNFNRIGAYVASAALVTAAFLGVASAVCDMPIKDLVMEALRSRVFSEQKQKHSLRYEDGKIFYEDRNIQVNIREEQSNEI